MHHQKARKALLPWLYFCLIYISTSMPSYANLHSDPLLYLGKYMHDTDIQKLFDKAHSKTGTKALQSYSFSMGFQTDDLWFYVSANNTSKTPSESFLVLDNPLIDSVTVYLKQPGIPIMQYELGDELPFDSRPVKHGLFLVPITIEIKKTTEALIRIRSHDAIMGRMYFSKQSDFYRSSGKTNTLTFSLFSALICLVVYHFAFFVKTRELAFLKFSLFIATTILLFLVQNGLMFQWFWPTNPSWHNTSDPFFRGLSIYYGSVFIRSYFGRKRVDWRLDIGLSMAGYSALLGSFISLYNPNTFVIKFLFLSFALMVTVCLGIWYSLHQSNYKISIYFTACWLFLIAGATLQVMLELGWLPTTPLVEYAFIVGFTLQVWFIAYGLTETFNEQKQLRLSAQSRLIGEMRSIAKKEAQLREAKEQLIITEQRQNVLLEQRVNERTQQLELTLNELTQAKQDAEVANQQKSRFLAAASHDIRQPLYALSLLTESSLLKDSKSNKEVPKRIHAATTNLVNLFESLFDLSKLENKVLDINPETVNLTRFINDVVDICQPILNHSPVTLSVQLTPQALHIYSDPMLLQRILLILIDNALKHARCKSLNICLGIEDDMATITVSDDGIGIPQQEQENIFEEFYQLKNPERNRKKGMGLGLSLCKRLSEALAISLSLSSTPNHGAIFKLSIPLSQPDQIPKTTNNETICTESPLKGLKALLVEDDHEVLEAMVDLLQTWGLQITCASSVKEAITKYHAHEPQLAIIDIRLPDSDGVELAKKFSKTSNLRTKVLIVSGEISSPDSTYEFQFLRKPVKPSRLRAKILGLTNKKTPNIETSPSI